MSRAVGFRRALFVRLLAVAGVAAAGSISGCADDVRCVSMGDDDQCAVGGDAIVQMYDEGVACDDDECVTEILEGPFVEDGECCYSVETDSDDCGGPFGGGCVQEGRPFFVDERARTAPVGVVAAGGWTEGGERPNVAGLTKAERAVLAREWAESAAMEHASIASFARFAMDLMAVGAPAELVEAAHRAALDEAKHARQCFALASGYAGGDGELAPGPFPFGGAVDVRGDLVALAAATVREGCVGETLAALQAAEELAHAQDPVVRVALEQIAREESEHAELAWRTVRWALSVGDESVRRAVEMAFAAALEPMPLALADVAPFTSRVRAHGRLDPERVHDLHRRALGEIVEPCANALLASPPLPAAAVG